MTAPAGLTPRQAEVLAAVRTAIVEKGSSPSYAEIGAAAGLSSRGRVSTYITALVERGHLVRGRKGKHLTLRLAEGPGIYRVVIDHETDRRLQQAAKLRGSTPERTIGHMLELLLGTAS